MSATRSRVLAVDDQRSNLLFLRHILEDEFEVSIETSGERAVDRCATTPPDLVLLDVVMPEIDGYEVCRRLKGQKSTREIPVIFVTSQSSPESETDGFSVGAVDFIVKPYSPSVVLARVRTHLTLRHQTLMLRASLAEIHRTQARMVQTQKAQAIGSLAAGIAHEINTPVQYVGDNLTFLKKAFSLLGEVGAAAEALIAGAPEGAPGLTTLARATKKAKLGYLLTEVPEALAHAREGLDRVAAIVGALQECAQSGEGEKTSVDIARVLDTTIQLARNEWKRVAEVETRFAPDLPTVLGHRDELNQAFLNLIVNAAQAIGERGSPEEKGHILVTAHEQEGSLVIEVHDDGPGIPSAIRGRIFDPFFTTKPEGKGMGQGLTIAHRIIAGRHGGRIDVHSEVGKGARFVVRLPLEKSTPISLSSEP